MSRLAHLKRSLKPLLQNPIPHFSKLPILNQNPHFLNPKNPLLYRQFSTTPPLSSPDSSTISDAELRKYMGYAALLLSCAAATYYSFPFPENAKHKKAQMFKYAPLPDDLHTVSNWSGTHEVHTRNFVQPESVEELERVVREAHHNKHKIRPVGSGLSPNGIGLTRAGMVNLALLDKVLEVDKERKIVRVQAGIRVQELVDGIKEFGITLQNFASIREQQIGGIVQVCWRIPNVFLHLINIYYLYI